MTTRKRTGTPTRKRVRTLRRLTPTPNGNPRFSVIFDDGTRATTYPNAMSAYAITPGWEGRLVNVYQRGRHVEIELAPQD